MYIYIYIYILHSMLILVIYYSLDYIPINEYSWFFLEDSEKWIKYYNIILSFLSNIEIDLPINYVNVINYLTQENLGNIFYRNSVYSELPTLNILYNEYTYILLYTGDYNVNKTIVYY